MIILGLDPGTATTGFAFVEGTKKSPNILNYGILQTKAEAVEFMPKRLLEIGTDFESLLKEYRPEKAVVEDLFFFNNKKTVISVAQSRGMLLYLLAKYNVNITSITPLQVKQTVCGYGRATKKQIQTVVQKLYQMPTLPTPDDAADSLAMAWIGLL